MLLGRRFFLVLLVLGLLLGDVQGATGALCRILCALRGCDAAQGEAEAPGETGGSCCLKHESVGPRLATLHDARELCPCSVRAPSAATPTAPPSSRAGLEELHLFGVGLLGFDRAPRFGSDARAGSLQGPPQVGAPRPQAGRAAGRATSPTADAGPPRSWAAHASSRPQ
jgi:hypothetical protein